MTITSQKKKLAAGAVAGIAALALIGGGTFALWSDFDTVTGGAVGAGTLSLTATGVVSSGVAVGKLVPGGSVDKSFGLGINDSSSDVTGSLFVRMVNLQNLGDVCDSQSEDVVDNSCGAPVDGASGIGELGDEAVAVVKVKLGDCTSDTTGFTTVNTSSALKNYNNFPIDTGLDLAPGQKACVVFEVSLPSGATDLSQGDGVTFDMRFDIEQNL